ncbi:MAG: DNA translocase FtsK 4TM domain-containing protein [Holosporales bacterium]|jgi:S-DNA-T family DNA segregation ATPase FtsK/SpoIIIE
MDTVSIRTKTLLPSGVVRHLRRRLEQLLALVLGGVGIFFMGALLTYHSADPSWNTAGISETRNLFGSAGAGLADAVVQVFGVGSFFLLAVVLLLAVQGWRGHGMGAPSRRLLLAIVAATLAAIAAAPWPEGTFWSLPVGEGGWLGTLFYGLVHRGVAGQAWLPWVVSIVAALLSLVTLRAAAGVPWRDTRRVCAWLFSATYEAFIALKNIIILATKALSAAVDRAVAWVSIRLAARSSSGVEENDIDDVFFGMPRPLGDEVANDNAANKAAAKKEKKAPKPKTAAAAKPATTIQPTGTTAQLPPLALLNAEKGRGAIIDAKTLKSRAEQLAAVLNDFGVSGKIVDAKPGPVVTLYELEPAAGVKSSRIITLADDIARSMSALSARIAIIPGRNVIGIELPNPQRDTVYLRELLTDTSYKDTQAKLPLALGKDIGGNPVVADLARMPHLLVAGTTGSGKSVSVNAMILSLLFKMTPAECRLIMIDPKMLELSIYDDIPHLLAPVVTDPGKAVVALKWAVKEMEQRYQAMSRLGVRNLDGYNQRLAEARSRNEPLTRRVQTGFDPDNGKPIYEDQPMPLDPLPYIVVIVDEMADLMLVAGKDIEGAIQRLAQMARAAGIHLVMATQRPSVDVITGTIKANFPTRISFQVTSKIDSRTILSEQGAEQLLGQGDMLHMVGGGRISRVHGPFVSDGEVEAVVRFLKAQGAPQYVEDVTIDDSAEDFASGGDTGDADNDLYHQAVAIVRRDGKASTSYIQRQLQIGYNRAARIIEDMEQRGVISKPTATGKREIL